MKFRNPKHKGHCICSNKCTHFLSGEATSSTNLVPLDFDEFTFYVLRNGPQVILLPVPCCYTKVVCSQSWSWGLLLQDVCNKSLLCTCWVFWQSVDTLNTYKSINFSDFGRFICVPLALYKIHVFTKMFLNITKPCPANLIRSAIKH